MLKKNIAKKINNILLNKKIFFFDTMIKKLSIIIPVYNEEKTIGKIIEQVLRQKYIKKEIIIINDASTDNSLSILRKISKKNNIKVINNTANQGKGYCVSKGIKIATGDYIVIQDADLEYNPKDFKKMIKLITSKNNVVYGSRFIKYKFLNSRYFINKGLTFISNLLFKQNLTDAHTCYRMLESKLFKELKIKEKKFAIEIEINAKISARKINIVETKIDYRPRTNQEGKKIGFKDGVEALYKLFMYKILSYKDYKSY